jgi:hypothetical protein
MSTLDPPFFAPWGRLLGARFFGGGRVATIEGTQWDNDEDGAHNPYNGLAIHKCVLNRLENFQIYSSLQRVTNPGI